MVCRSSGVQKTKSPQPVGSIRRIDKKPTKHLFDKLLLNGLIAFSKAPNSSLQGCRVEVLYFLVPLVSYLSNLVFHWGRT